MKKNILLIFSLILTTALFAGGYKVGDKADNFKLKGVDGKKVSLKDYSDEKGVIVIFTCNHCPYAKLYEDRIIALNNEYAPKGFPVVAINPNDPEVQPEDSFDLMKVRAEEKGFTFPYLFDAKQEVYPAFGATRTPHVYLLKNKGGDFYVKYIGAIDDNARDASKVEEEFVATAIDALMAGERVATTETKAVGCSIKTK
ncbi:MAG: thioredoxin family protein [Bacteroidetes bacterium]|nr:thioredoxin family protein [Bacteroidota bacterium]